MKTFIFAIVLCLSVSLDAYVLPETKGNKIDIEDELIKNLTRQVAALNNEVKALRKQVDVSQSDLEKKIKKEDSLIGDIKKDVDMDILAANVELNKTKAKLNEMEKGDVSIKENVKHLQSNMKKEMNETGQLKSIVNQGNEEISLLQSIMKKITKNVNAVNKEMGAVGNRTDKVEKRMGQTSDLVQSLQKILQNETHGLSQRISTLASYFNNLINSKTGDLNVAFAKALQQYHPYGLVFAGRGYPTSYSCYKYRYVRSFDSCYKFCSSFRKKYGDGWDSIAYDTYSKRCVCHKNSRGFEESEDYIYLHYPPYKYN